jgi:hypothetical protein
MASWLRNLAGPITKGVSWLTKNLGSGLKAAGHGASWLRNAAHTGIDIARSIPGIGPVLDTLIDSDAGKLLKGLDAFAKYGSHAMSASGEVLEKMGSGEDPLKGTKNLLDQIASSSSESTKPAPRMGRAMIPMR